ncbi:MAG: hypothetical protein KC733_11075, partial [Candidatus Omnitrophica bacterium]|nr:hypothetical protein [Candidatus Omnitrophota bacterium]
MKLFFFLGFILTILIGVIVLRKQQDLTPHPFRQKLIFYFPAVIIIFFIGLKFLDPKLYRALVVYEGGVEDLQAINYLLSAVVAGIITRDLIKTRKTLYAILYGIAALGFGF